MLDTDFGKVSVVITTYKREMSILKRCVNSVINQTYKRIEIIIVNDYPPYRDIIDEVFEKSKNVLIIHNTVNLGACVSRNIGAASSNGEFIAFLDDDDEWDRRKIEKQIDKMGCGIGLVYCKGVLINSDKTRKVQKTIYDCNPNPFDKLLVENCIGGCSYPLLRKSVFETVGGFDKDFKSCQDYDLWLRVIEISSCVFIDEPLVLYHVSSDAITSNFANRVQGYLLLFEKHSDKYRTHKMSGCLYLKEVIIKCFYNRSISSANLFIKKSFQLYPYNLPMLLNVICTLIGKFLNKAVETYRKK